MTKHLILTVFLATCLLPVLQAQTSAAEIRQLMDAVEERHEAAEDAMATAFELMNDYHTQVMASPDVVLYSRANEPVWWPRIAYRDAFVESLKKPEFEFDLEPEDYDVAAPKGHFIYTVTGDPQADADAQQAAQDDRDAALANWQAQLTAAQEAQYEPLQGDQHDETGTSETFDPVGAQKTIWEEWNASRNKAIEDGEDSPPFYIGSLYNFPYITPPPNPDIALRNQQHEAEWNVQNQREIDRAQRGLDSVGDLYEVDKSGDSDSDDAAIAAHDAMLDQYNADVAAWQQAKDAWHEQERLTAATDFLSAAESYPADLQAKLNSPSAKAAFAKFTYLWGLRNDRRDYTCGVPFSPATIKWSHENPTGLEQELVALNEISKHLERIAAFYLHLGNDSGTMEWRTVAEMFPDSFQPIGIVNRENNPAKILEIKQLIRNMDTLVWPMLVRSYATPMSIPAGYVSAGTATRNLGESSILNAFTGGNVAGSGYSPNSAEFLGKPWITTKVSWWKKLKPTVNHSDDPSQFASYADGMMRDIITTNGDLAGSLYLISNSSKSSIRDHVSSNLPMDGSYSKVEFQPTAVTAGGNLVDFVASVTDAAPDPDYDPQLADAADNKIAQANYLLEHVAYKVKREYATSAEALGLPGSIELATTLSSASGNSHSVELNGALKSNLPSTQIEVNDAEFGKYFGDSTMVFQPDFSHVPDEPYAARPLPSPEIGFASGLRSGRFGLVMPLPFVESSSSEGATLVLPLMNVFGQTLAYPSREATSTHQLPVYSGTGKHHGFWDNIELNGNLADAVLETQAAPDISSYHWDDGSTFGAHDLSAYMAKDLNSPMTAFKSITGSHGKVEFEWLGHYHFKIKYFYHDSEDPVRTYEVFAGGVADGGQVIEQETPEDVYDPDTYDFIETIYTKYPEHFEQITIKKDDFLWARATLIEPATVATATDSEYARVEFFDDAGELAWTEYHTDDGFDSMVDAFTTSIKTEHASGEVITQTLAKENFSSPSVPGLPDYLLSNHEDWTVGYDYVNNPPDGYVPMMTYIWGDYSFGLPRPSIYAYTDDFLTQIDGESWKHLPLFRYPMSRTLTGNEWERDGEVLTYDQAGNLSEHQFKIGGMNAVRSIEQSADTVTDTLAIDESVIRTRQTSYPAGLAKTVVTADGLESTVEYYTANSTDGLAWQVKSIESETGTTTFTYALGTDDALTVTATFDPVAEGDSNTVTTTVRNKHGSLVSELVKVGTATVSSAVASGHDTNPFRLPTEVVITAAGVTRTHTLEYHPDGSLKKTNDGNGGINEYAWDVLGRIKSGSSFDGQAVVPTYNGLENKLSVGGDEIVHKSDVYGKLLEFTDPSGPGLKVTKESPDTYQTEIISQGRGFSSSALPDGTPDGVSGGLGSPGQSLGYAVAEVNGVNCIEVTSTVLAGSQETDIVVKSYFDGFGRIIRRQEPHPMGTGVVNTDYAYDTAQRRITITPPSPAKPIVIQFAEGWKDPVVTQGGQDISVTSTTVDGVVTEVVKLAGRELFSSTASLENGVATTKENGRNAVTSTPSADGNQVAIAGPSGFDLDLNFDRYGLSGMTGSVGGESLDADVTRNAKGEVQTVSVDPPGPTGDTAFNFDPNQRLSSVSGPGTQLGLEYDYTDGGVQVSGTDTETNEDFLVRSDAEGNPRQLAQTGRDSLAFDGSIYEGNMTLDGAGFADQTLNFNYGPTGLPLSFVRADGSGKSFDWHADSSLDSYTRFDGAANGGGSDTFVMTRDATSGLPTGFTGTNCSLLVVPNMDGTVASVQFDSTDMDGQAQTYSAQYPAYFDDAPLIETFGGMLAGYEVRRNYNDQTGEITRVELWQGGTLAHAVDYTADGRSQVGTVTASVGKTFAASYGYPDGLTETLTAGPIVVTKSFLGDGTGRQASVSTNAGGEVYSAAFGFNGLRRSGLTLTAPGEAAEVWSYTFANAAHSTGQLQSASSSAGPSYSYQHDAAGNRAGSLPNNANQYAISQVAGSRHYTITGQVVPGATVTISQNGGPAEAVDVAPDGSFTKAFTAPAGGIDPANIPHVIEGTIPGAGDNGTDAVAAENTVVTLAPSSWTTTYGAHGALSADWRWSYEWDCLGRLSGMETQAQAVAAGMQNLKLKFAYDDQGRRIEKTVLHLDSSGTVERMVTTKFVYDGWRLLAEEISDSLNGDTTRHYTWGKDIAGGLEGTGGVGGLLAIHQDGATYCPIYDSNGNVIALVDAADGSQVARWRRGPFGEMIAVSGDRSLCHFGFATHYTDAETGLVYFGHRYYSPETGRWLSREPLGEMESFNLYAYCHNDPVNKVDVLGLAEKDVDESEENFISRIVRGFFETIAPTLSAELTTDPKRQVALRRSAVWQDEVTVPLLRSPGMAVQAGGQAVSEKALDWGAVKIAGDAPIRGYAGGVLGQFAGESISGVGGLLDPIGMIGSGHDYFVVQANDVWQTSGGGLNGFQAVARHDLTKWNVEQIYDGFSSGNTELGLQGIANTSGVILAVFLPQQQAGRWSGGTEVPPGLNWVKDIPKGKRPHPATYLSVSERMAVDSLFDQGAVRFTTLKNIDKYGTAGSADAFVFPKSYFNKVVAEADGDLRVIERRLGLDAGTLGNPDTVAAFISRSDFSRLRIPTGNEAGANSFWIPGGRTSGRVPEMLLDLRQTPFTIVPFK